MLVLIKSLYNSTYLFGFVHSYFVLHHSCCCWVTGCHVPTVLLLHKEDWFQGEQNLYVGRFKWALVGVAFWLGWAEWVLSSMCVGVMVSSVNLERNDRESVCVFLFPPTSSSLEWNANVLNWIMQPFVINCYICAKRQQSPADFFCETHTVPVSFSPSSL